VHNPRREVQDKGKAKADAQSQTSPKGTQTCTCRAQPAAGPLPSLPRPRPMSDFWLDDPKLFPLAVRLSLSFSKSLLILFLF